ncbi:MAG: glycosyltransferase family 2 protein, partial [Pseudomonadota bacterium]
MADPELQTDQTDRTATSPSIAVILPCHNEAIAIADTVAGFRSALPDALIVVCDNASSDATIEKAEAAGAAVIRQPLRGKGNAVRRLFAEVDADVFVMADGDATYDPSSAPEMIQRLIEERLDMVIGWRKGQGDGQYRFGNVAGNRFYSRLFSLLFNMRVNDLFSGYRIMSRR